MQGLSVLVIHNQYRQPGGEDAVVRAEVELLRRAGHRVVQYSLCNVEIDEYSPWRKASLLLTTTWNPQSYREIRDIVRQHRPDVAHCHNFLPLVSPAAHYACKEAGTAVVQTLHNYRLLCPAATFYRNGLRCTRCLRGSVHGIVRGCYRNSALQTGTVSLMLATHRALRSWTHKVDAFITPSRFSQDYFVKGGLPSQRIHCKPNFLATDPGAQSEPAGYALFVGRLSEEKGVMEMLRAWQQLPEVPLLVIGDGPLWWPAIQLAAQAKGRIQFLGQLDSSKTMAYLQRARCLIFPSRWYEPFGMALLEAGACGVPAIASRIGAIPELVQDHDTGLLFDPDNTDDLAARVRWAWAHAAEMAAMGKAARQQFLQSYTAEANYERLMSIYRRALGK